MVVVINDRAGRPVILGCASRLGQVARAVVRREKGAIRRQRVGRAEGNGAVAGPLGGGDEAGDVGLDAVIEVELEPYRRGDAERLIRGEVTQRRRRAGRDPLAGYRRVQALGA